MCEKNAALHRTPLPARSTASTRPQATAALVATAGTPAKCCATCRASVQPPSLIMGALHLQGVRSHEPPALRSTSLHACGALRTGSLSAGPCLGLSRTPLLPFVLQIRPVRWHLQGAEQQRAPHRARLTDGRWLHQRPPKQGSHCSSHLVSAGRGREPGSVGCLACPAAFKAPRWARAGAPASACSKWAADLRCCTSWCCSNNGPVVTYFNVIARWDLSRPPSRSCASPLPAAATCHVPRRSRAPAPRRPTPHTQLASLQLLHLYWWHLPRSRLPSRQHQPR